jgi:rSAM/selenodomain-associated transferase 2
VPAVSIIIPTLNEERALPAALTHAAAVADSEIIVADGGSEDRTVAIAHDFGCAVVDSPPGRAFQMNAGASHAAGELLVFLHADCLLPAAAGEELRRIVADESVEYGAFRHRIASSRAAFRLIEACDNLRARWLKLPYGDQAIFVRRRVFKACGGFPGRAILEEVELMRRLRRAGRRFRLLQGPIATGARRWERSGIVRTTLINWTVVVGDWIGVSDQRLREFYGGPRSATGTPPESAST